MSKKIGQQGNANVRPDLVRQQPITKSKAKGAAALDESPRVDVNDIDLPAQFPGLSGQPSALHNVIQAGLSSLAKANNWEATDNALGVLVKAMVGASSSKVNDGPEVSATLPMEFQRLLRGFVPPGDAAALSQLKTDAKQLVQLAVVALGTDDLEGLPKAKQEAQLETDVRAIHGAIGDVLKLPSEQRAKILAASDQMLSWKANVLDRSAKALDAAKVNTPARIDALVGIFQIISRYGDPA